MLELLVRLIEDEQARAAEEGPTLSTPRAELVRAVSLRRDAAYLRPTN